jgi:hypothetical protein
MQVGNAADFKFIRAQDVADGYDYLVDLDVTNATPAAMEQSKQSYMNFVAMVQNYPMIALSPILIRETAYRCGYRNEKVIQQMQQAALVQQQMNLLQKQQQAGGQQQGQQGQNAPNAAQQHVAQMAPQTQAQTEQQIKRQLQ